MLIKIDDAYNTINTLLLESISRIVSKIKCIEYHQSVHLYVDDDQPEPHVILSLQEIPKKYYLGTLENIDIELDNLVLSSTCDDVFNSGKIEKTAIQRVIDFIYSHLSIDQSRIILTQ